MKLKLLQLGMQVKKRSPMVMFMGLVAINTKRILSYDLFLLFKARVHYLETYLSKEISLLREGRILWKYGFKS